MSDRYRALVKAREVARASQDSKAQKNFERRVKAQGAVTPLHVGDGVALREQSGPSLQSKWSPGYKVIDIRGPVVTIEKDGQVKRVNRERLKFVPLDSVGEELNPRHRRRLQDNPQWTVQKGGGGLKLKLKKVSEVSHLPKTEPCLEWSSWLQRVAVLCQGPRHRQW